MIPAGNYKLTNLMLFGGSLGSYLTFEGLQIEGSFSVSESEAVYLDYIFTNLISGTTTKICVRFALPHATQNADSRAA